MDPSVKTALNNLQGLRDEGFINEGEFNARRKKILDDATSVKPATAAASGKASVFSRLGSSDEPTGTTGGGKRPAQQLYPGGSRKVEVVKQGGAGGVRKPLAGGISKGSKTSAKNDLRSKITGALGGAPKPMKKNLPAKCPW